MNQRQYAASCGLISAGCSYASDYPNYTGHAHLMQVTMHSQVAHEPQLYGCTEMAMWAYVQRLPDDFDRWLTTRICLQVRHTQPE